MLFQRTQFALISITKRNGGVLRIPPHYTQWLSRYQMIAPVCRSSHSFPGNTRLLSSSPKAYQKRVLGAIAHINSGKTTTSEAMLYAAGALRRMGNVDIGNTMMDFLPAERERGITINAAAICFDWKDHQFFLVDSPGHLDFTFEVERALKVMDGVIVLLDAVAGVQPQTETVWRQADSNGLARVIFVNKMDRDGADFDKTVESVRQNFKTTPAVIQVPIFDKETGRFCGIYDLLERFEGGCMKTGLMGKNDADEDFIGSYDDLSMELKEGVDKAVGHLFETVAEVDDGVMALWIEEKVASKEVMVQALRDACISGELIPVVCGSSLKHIGVEPLMDSVIKYLPSPQERSAVRGVSKGGKDLLIKTCPSAPFLAYAFKVSHDKHRGRLVHLRAFSGDLQEKNKSFLNTTKGKPESPSRLLRVLADKFIDINSVTTGDIFAAVRDSNSPLPFCHLFLFLF